MLNKFKELFFWFKSYKKYIAFINRNINNLSQANEKNPIYFTIIIEPWKFTSLPWYAITLGLLLLRKGHHVKILLTNIPFETYVDFNAQIFFTKRILNLLKKNMSVELLSNTLTAQEPVISDETKKDLYNLAFANAIHRNLGEIQGASFHKEISKNYNQYLKYFSVIDTYMSKNKNEYFIISGGIYGFSGLFLKLAKENNSKFFTYDSGFEIMLASISGVAAHCKDTAMVAKRMLDENNLEEIKRAKYLANEELNKRVNGTNSFKTQYQNIENSIKIENVGFLIPLNSPWDSAALNIDTLFSSYREWLVETVDLILKHTNEHVTVRQHPDERHWYGRSNLDFGEILREKFNLNPRIQYISCTDKVNTYALLNNCNTVICFSSTFGVEAALYNKNVIVCSDVYYSNFNFVKKAVNINHLIQLIKEKTNIKLNQEQLNEASVMFYLGQKCNWLHTPFTPTPDDFLNWCKLSLENLSELENVETYLESIIKHIPIPEIINSKIQNIKLEHV